MKTKVLIDNNWSPSTQRGYQILVDESTQARSYQAYWAKVLWLLTMVTTIPILLAAQTVTTDKVDYHPGDKVIASGKYWQPYEQIDLVLAELNFNNPGATLMVTADGYGKFKQEIYTVVDADRGAFFHLKATGRTSKHVSTVTFNDDGGSYGIDFASYDPKHYELITYDQYLYKYGSFPTGATPSPLTDPSYEDPGSTDHSKTHESLMPEGLGLGQIVPFEFFIRVDSTLPCDNDRMRFTAHFSTVTTNGGDFGFDGASDRGVVAAFVCNSPDPSFIDNGSQTRVSNFDWYLVNKRGQPDPNGEIIEAVIELEGFTGGDEIPVEVWLVLKESIVQSVGGNVQSALISASTNGTCGGSEKNPVISTGNQTVPLLQSSSFYTAQVDVSLSKTDQTAAPDDDIIFIGDKIKYFITVTNNGPSVANTVSVIDTLDVSTTYVASSFGYTSNQAWALAQNGGILTFTSPFLEIGASATLWFEVQVGQTASHTGNGGEGTCAQSPNADLCNKAIVTTITEDTNLANNRDSEPTGVGCTTLSVSATPVAVTCFGEKNGSVHVTASGGISPYTFSLGTSSNSTGDFSGLAASATPYLVTVLDAVGCTGEVSFTITQPSAVTLRAESAPVTCFGSSDGTITATAGGGDGTYMFSLNNSDWQSSNVFTDKASGNYTVYVKDENGPGAGCTANTPITVDEPNLLVCNIEAPSYTKPICGEHQSNTISATVTGGTESYTYVWTIVASNSSDAANWYVWEGAGTSSIKFSAGNYPATIQLKVIDANGCETNCEFEMYGCSDEYYCTYTQGFYGNEGGAACSIEGKGATAYQMMTTALPTGSVKFGMGEKVFELFATDITKMSIFNMLPGGTTPQPLLGYATYDVKTSWPYVPIDGKGPNEGRINNVLLAQAITLWFNVKQNTSFDLGGLVINGSYLITADAKDCGVHLAVPYQDIYTIIPPSVVNTLVSRYGAEQATVSNLLDLANRMLGAAPELVTITTKGGKRIYTYPSITPAELTQALDAINRGFDECRIFVEFTNENPESAFAKNIGYKPVYAGTVDVTTSEVVLSEEGDGQPYNVTVHTYPNPFTDQITFEFVSEVDTWGVLQVYSLNGVKVQTLYEGPLNGREPKRIVFSANGISSGVYQYKLTTGPVVQTGRIMLIK